MFNEQDLKNACLCILKNVGQSENLLLTHNMKGTTYICT